MRVTVEFQDGEEITSDELEGVSTWKEYIAGFGDELGVVIHKGTYVRIIPWASIRQIYIPKEDG